MAFWDRLRSFARRSSLSFQGSLENPSNWMISMFGGGTRSATGAFVTPTTALRSVSVFAAVRNIAEDVAKLPLKVFRWQDASGKSKEPAIDHPLYPLLHDAPNPEQTSVEFREGLVAHALLRGNSFAEIVRNGVGKITALWPIYPDFIRLQRLPSGDLVYWVGVPPPLFPQLGKAEVPLRADQVLHLRGISFDGVLGNETFFTGREAIGLTLAVDEYGSRFFGNNAQPGGVLKVPSVLSPEAQQRLRANWQGEHQGLTMAHRVAILEGGMEWQQTAVQNEHAQFTQTRAYQMREMARLLRIPPHKLGDLERATFSNIEHQAIEYVTDTLLPWLVRIEQKMQHQLLTVTERRQYFIRHVVSGLLRGDLQARYAAYAIGRQWSWLSPDDVRAFEDMDPLPDGLGKDYIQPLNFTVLGAPVPVSAAPGPKGASQDAGTPGSDTGPPGDTGSGEAPMRALSLFVGDCAQRALRREQEAIRKAAVKDAANGEAWRTWVDEFYARHAAYLAELLHISLDAARQYTEDHRALLLANGAGVAETWNGQAVHSLMALATQGIRSAGTVNAQHAPVTVNVTVPPITVDARTTIERGAVEVPVTVAAAEQPAAPNVVVNIPPVKPIASRTDKQLVKDAQGRTVGTIERHTPIAEGD